MPVRGDNSLFFSTGLDNSGLKQGKLDAEGIIRGLADTISKINPFAALAVGALTAFAAISKAAYKMAQDYETAMAEVKTIANLTNEEFKELSEEVVRLSDTLGTEPPDKLAKGLYEIIGAGFEAGEALKILEIASKSATAGVTDSGTASDGLTTILNSFQLGAEDATEVADIMFATVDRGKISFEELAGSIATVAPLAASSGFTFDQIGGAISTLTKQGVPAGVAMTQIRSSIVALNDVLGSDVGKVYTYQEALQELYDRADGDQNKLKDLAGRIEAVGAVLGIAGPKFESATEDLEAMGNAAGSVDKNFKIISGTSTNQWEIFRLKIKETTRTLGNFIVEGSSKLARSLNFMTKNFNSVSQSMERQRIELLALQLELNETNTSEERRIEIYDILKRKYPEILGNLSLETSSMEELNDAIEQVNKSLIDKITLQLQEERISEKAEEAGNIQLDLLTAESELRRKIVKEAERLGVELDKNADILENAAKVQAGLDKAERGKTGGFGSAGSVKSSTFLQSDINEIRGYRLELAELQGDVTDLTKQRNEIKVSLGLENDQEIIDVLDKELSEQFQIIADAKSRAELAPFLKSENEKIKEAARARIEALKILYKPQGDDDSFKKFLKNQLKQYDEYEISKKQIGKEFADEAYADLLKGGNDYGEFLDAQLKLTKDFEKQKAIAQAAERAGIRSLDGKKLEKVEVIIQPIVKDVDIDTTSINAIEKKIQRLIDKRNKSRTKAERDVLKVQIEAAKERLKIAQDATDAETQLYQNITTDLDSLTGKQLDGYIDYWRKRLSVAKAGSDAEIDAQGKVEAGQRQKFENISTDIVSNLSNIADAFDNFGDETTADLLRGLSALGGEISGIFDAFNGEQTSGERYGQAAQAASSLIALVINGAAERKAAEKAYYTSVIAFQKEYNQLLNEQILAQDSANDNVFTFDYINELKTGIDALSDASDRYQKSIYELGEAGQVKEGQRNVVSGSNVLTGLGAGAALGTAIFPGIGTAIGAVVGGIIGLFVKKKKDLFVGILQEFPELVTRTEEGIIGINKELAQSLIAQNLVNDKTKILLQDTLNWAKRIEEAREQIKGVVSDLAGGLGDNLRDALVGAFEDGTDAAKVMGDEVGEVLQGILEQLIFDQIFSGQFRKLQDEMENSFDIGGDQSWIDDFSRFFKEGATLTEDFNQALTDAQAQGAEFGFDLFTGGSDSQEKQGLSGAISTITEDTAGILAGAMNSIRLDVSNGLDVARDSNFHLAAINRNTFDLLESSRESNTRLESIENLL